MLQGIVPNDQPLLLCKVVPCQSALGLALIVSRFYQYIVVRVLNARDPPPSTTMYGREQRRNCATRLIGQSAEATDWWGSANTVPVSVGEVYRKAFGGAWRSSPPLVRAGMQMLLLPHSFHPELSQSRGLRTGAWPNHVGPVGLVPPGHLRLAAPF